MNLQFFEAWHNKGLSTTLPFIFRIYLYFGKKVLSVIYILKYNTLMDYLLFIYIYICVYRSKKDSRRLIKRTQKGEGG